MEAKPHLRLGLEPEAVHILIQKALSEQGDTNFVGIRQAAIYALMYYITARFEEIKVLELRQICKKGASLEVLIYKGKRNQKMYNSKMYNSSYLFQFIGTNISCISS